MAPAPPAFGAPPDDWTGQGYFGPLQSPLPMSLRTHASWGEFYADERLAPSRNSPRTSSTRAHGPSVDTVISRCGQEISTMTTPRACMAISGAGT